MAIEFSLNDEPVTVDVDPDMPLLWVVRERLGLTGTKFGCGVAACGACTMHVDGVATRTCVLPVANVAGAKIKTIEALAADENPDPTDADIDAAITNICRCGTYDRVRTAVHAAAKLRKAG